MSQFILNVLPSQATLVSWLAAANRQIVLNNIYGGMRAKLDERHKERPRKERRRREKKTLSPVSPIPLFCFCCCCFLLEFIFCPLHKTEHKCWLIFIFYARGNAYAFHFCNNNKGKFSISSRMFGRALARTHTHTHIDPTFSFLAKAPQRQRHNGQSI